MSISPKERFLDICHFKRPGDLCMLSAGLNVIAEHILKMWIEQGASEEITNPSFINDYFQFQHILALLP